MSDTDVWLMWMWGFLAGAFATLVLELIMIWVGVL